MAKSKLLLIRDVEDLGRSGDVVSVSPGYARNYLLPEELAVIADAGTLKMQAKLQEETQKRTIVEKKEAEDLASKMEGMVVATHVKVDHEGHMYGSVSSGDIVALISEQHGFNLEKRNIQLKHSIKEVGVFEIPIKLKEGVMSGVTIKIIPEEQQPHSAL